MSPSELTTALNWRYATKAFDPGKPLPDDVWQALLDSLVLAPSSFGLQPWKFIVVSDPELRQRLRDNSWGQPQVTDADKLVVFTSRVDMTPKDINRWIARLSEVQGQTPEELKGYAGIVEGFCQRMSPEARHNWNIRQTYIALGQFMASAAAIGVDTCPLEGIDPAGYDHELGLAGSGYATCVACAAGYRSADDKSATRPKARFVSSEV
ncbi:NAD(P)H-dependent oxidoreductase, partial [Haloferula sp.]|uniref:NAD(P)H-dependent oxidoreductase n=1 Tax=Haloferula sp. TaxID=2497595 RepID=UPI003C78C122